MEYMSVKSNQFHISILYALILFPLLDLQTVNLTLRILFHPDPTLLPSIYTNVGVDYDERILPSIVDEVLKSVVVSSSINVGF